MSKKESYLNFIELSNTGKTSRYAVIAKRNLDTIGYIQWYGGFRKYSFYPSGDTIWDSKCLNEVVEFMDILMEERKQKK